MDLHVHVLAQSSAKMHFAVAYTSVAKCDQSSRGYRNELSAWSTQYLTKDRCQSKSMPRNANLNAARQWTNSAIQMQTSMLIMAVYVK